MDLETGTIFGNYEILSKIGEGGMGLVYLAKDTKLDRKVALKVLPKDVVADNERLKRFEQEARAASALNHPNILTIHEIGDAEGKNYISTEFVDGKTLRQTMNGKGFLLHQAIEIAVQTASALAAAHEAGIIHRDIKPENIMVRKDGLVKVLDFGLAKLSVSGVSSGGSEDATRAQVKTAPGVIMGTVQYMSPEQTRGKGTDARSDIWSLGCVMYEMFSGRAPFSGESTADLIAEIVKGYPTPLTKIAGDIPERLDEIVSKTLEKDPDERYQSVKDLLIDLRRLKKKLDLDVELDRSNAPTAERRSGPDDLATRALSVAASDTIAGQATLSGAEAVTSSIKRHKFGVAAVFVIAAVVLAGFGYGLYRFLEKPQTEQPRAAADLKTQRLTGDGKTRETVISPDGKFLVYKRVENEKESLWIRQIQTNSNVQVVQAGELNEIGGLAFAPDGSFVYFNAESPGQDEYSIFKVPTLGGSPTRFLSNAWGIAFSSDGKQIAFGRFDIAAAETSISIANADGTNERTLATVRGKQFTNTRPAWSPDGKTIAVGIGDDDLLPGPQHKIGLISTTDGSISELSSRKWAGLSDLVWTPAGDAVLIVATEYIAAPGQVWEIGYPSGEPRRLTNSLSSYNWISITADGRSISLTEGETKSSIWVSPNTDPNSAKQIMPAKGDTWGISWTPDGRIVYVSDQSGDYEIWSMNADGSNAKQLTTDRILKMLPVVSPDGRYIVYTSAAGGGQLFRIDMSGGNPVQLTSGVGGESPDISIDSKWVLYFTYIDGKASIVRVPIGGGEPQKLYDGIAIRPRYSHDGKYFACFALDEKNQRWNWIAIVPADGGEAINILEVSPSLNANRGPVWTPDGKGITFLEARGEKTNMWVQPIEGGKPKQITNFDQPVIARREYSRDGKQIAIVRGELTSNAVLITGFR